MRGDVNGDGQRNVSDVLALINYLFAGGSAPATACGGDADTNGSTNVSDILFLINYLFAGGSAPGPC